MIRNLDFTPLTEQDRQANPIILFESKQNTITDIAHQTASYYALKDAGYTICLDVQESTNSHPIVTIRTNMDTEESETLGALYSCLQAASIRHEVKTSITLGTIEDYFQQAYNTSKKLLEEFRSQPTIVELFKAYIHSYQPTSFISEKIVPTLFKYGTEFDPEALEENISRYILNQVADILNLPNNVTVKWRDSDPKSILDQNPSLDFHNLSDNDFVQSDDGIALKNAYAQAYGLHIANVFNEQRHTRHTSSMSLLPLSKFPILEALICDQIDIYGPLATENNAEIFDISAFSDSAHAHNALTQFATSRLPDEKRSGNHNVLNRMNEFVHKFSAIQAICTAYRRLEKNEDGRALLNADILKISDAYAAHGPITESMRKESIGKEHKSVGHTDLRFDNPIRVTLTTLIPVMLAAPDKNLSNKALALISGILDTKNAHEDPTILTRAHLMILCLDTLDILSEDMNLHAFGKIAEEIFQSDDAGKTLQKIAEIGINIYSIYDVDSTKFDDTRNNFLLNMLEKALDTQDPNLLEAFFEIVDNVEISTYKITELPREYFNLMKLAQHPNISPAQRDRIIGHISIQLESLDSDTTYILPHIVLDIYSMYLGDPDMMIMPNSYTSRGLSHATKIVTDHPELFKSATDEQISTLTAYASAIKQLASRVLFGGLLKDDRHHQDEDFETWKHRTTGYIRDTYLQLTEIEKVYMKYQFTEDLRLQPNVFYPWALNEFESVKEDILAELSHRTPISPNLQQLRSFISIYSNTFLVYQKDPFADTFDPFIQGYLDSFLLGLSDHSRSIQDPSRYLNNRISNRISSFISKVIYYMPDTLIKRMLDSHPDRSISSYLRDEQSIRNKAQ